MGASIAYNLALRGATEVVLCDRGEVAGGATGKAMGGVRQQFSTPEEVLLAQASIRFFEELRPPLFEQVGYLFLATTSEGWEELRARAELQASLGVPVDEVDPAFVPGLRTDDLVGAVFCAQDGVASPPAITRELVRRAAELGVDVRERTPAEGLAADTLVIACGPWSAEVAAQHGVALPIRPLTRQLLATEPFDAPAELPMVVEAETGFHFRRREGRLVLAMADAEPRWGFADVDSSVFDDRLARLAHRYPAAGALAVADAWVGAYDMTPDAHPIIGEVAEGVYAACGFSGHGFMQSPAVGAALAEEILDGASSFDLSPFRLERFAGGAAFPETLIL
ncbi:MAG: FAD-binding oxidoreductase [Actinomycetota bacterium]|nr:FAD-binding oxidoreductase [Actinomycetota bacterium]